MTATFNMEWNKHVFTNKKKHIPNEVVIDSIKSSIKLATNVPFEHYDVSSRQRRLALLRFCFFKLAREHTNYTYKAIGELFLCNYNHSTVINGIDVIDSIEYLGYADKEFKIWLDIKLTYKLITKWK